MNRIIAMWVVPRSRSTAFERMMRARGDLTVIHEPFLAYYHYGEDRVNDHFNEGIEPDPSHHWSRTLEEILAAAERRPVFFKTMAYYLRKCMSPGLLGHFENTFLVRDPRHTLPSLYRLMPESTFEEAGFEQQLRLMRMVDEMTDEPLVVIDAEELGGEPERVAREYCERVGLPFLPESLHWEKGTPSEEWSPWARWHREAIESTGFETSEESAKKDDVAVPRDVQERCEAIYDEMMRLVDAASR